MTEKKTGRPPSYSARELEEAFQRAERETAEPTLAEIKRHLLAVSGLTKAPNDAVLQRNLDDMHSAREKRRRDELIPGLPEAVLDQVQTALETQRRTALAVVAETVEAEKRRLADRDRERETEKQALQFQLRAVEEERDRIATDREKAIEALDAAQQKAENLEHALDVARQSNEKEQSAADARERVFEIFEQVLSDRETSQRLAEALNSVAATPPIPDGQNGQTD